MKVKKFILFFLCLLQMNVKAEVQTQMTDSIPAEEQPRWLWPAVGGGLVVGGSLLGFDHGGSRLGMSYTPSFSYKADEVLRFVPAITLVGMKAFGVESRTEKWGELVVRSAASTAIMGLAVEGTKRVAGRVRPDGSDDRSFPSGHSAAAFLTASLFAKEYGHLSPWYSVGAYGVATSTAMLRRVNDHHWTGDVMVGAGIGILSAELAYLLADIYYGTKNRSGVNPLQALPDVPSSMAGVYMNYVFPRAISGKADGQRVRSHMGYGVGMEAFHFFTPYVGVNGRMGLTTFQMEIACDGKGSGGGDWLVSERPLDHVSMAVGPCVSLPMGRGCSIGAHLRGGYGFYPKTKFSRAELVDICIRASQGWGVEGGLSVNFLTSQGVSLQMFADYNSWSPITEELQYRGFSVGLSAGWGW